MAPVIGDPLEILQVRRLDLLFGERFVGEQPRFDALGEGDLLLGVQQGDLADLLEVVLDGSAVAPAAHDLLFGFVGIVGVRQRETFVLVDLLLVLGRFLVIERVLIDLVEDPLLAPHGQDDVVALPLKRNVRHTRLQNLGHRGLGVLSQPWRDHAGPLPCGCGAVLPRWPQTRRPSRGSARGPWRWWTRHWRCFVESREDLSWA